MLQLKSIKKDYVVAGNSVPALKGINLNFKRNEFVSILGPSGCGKTTLLNIIGGLDRYTSGDLLIDGKSTKDFKDQDWDSYRNTTIGFVFQSYNLISHLTVLDNVEIALKLSGISAKESKERATRVLEEVGLAAHLQKRPNQLSGGQMQRVAIARALVNDPKILLADEPTGALDTQTSVQIMRLIQRISQDRLVIMVTHNPELANEYSDRIIRLLDGLVIEDSKPTSIEHVRVQSEEKLVTKKTSMPYLVALKTSFNNLLTKKGRTIITMIAGSIGIIGIALVLSISTGMNRYVGRMQSDTLAGFPITISQRAQSFDPEAFQKEGRKNFPQEPVIYSYSYQSSMGTHINRIDQAYVDYIEALDKTLYNSISYIRGLSLHIFTETSAGGIIPVPTNLMGAYSIFSELPDNEDFIDSQYDILAGTYPSTANEVVLVVDRRNQIEINILNSLGFPMNDEYRFEDFIGKTYKVMPNNVYYQFKEETNTYGPKTDYESLYQSSEAIPLQIVGIIRVKKDATTEIISSGIGYSPLLTDRMLADAMDSDVVVAQRKSSEINMLTGEPFNTQTTYQSIMQQLGGDTTPTSIEIYPISFEAKDAIKDYLDQYNVGKAKDDRIIYTDLAEMITSAIGGLINTIAIILSAFAGISLVVSSVMIGIITYVSVVERTKEIGIMRSIGARKKDISRIFNAETILIGLGSGLFGVIISFILTFPINLIIQHVIDVSGFSILTFSHAFWLTSLSTLLTLIAGLVPSGIASRKDPVIALRTE